MTVLRTTRSTSATRCMYILLLFIAFILLQVSTVRAEVELHKGGKAFEQSVTTDDDGVPMLEQGEEQAKDPVVLDDHKPPPKFATVPVDIPGASSDKPVAPPGASGPPGNGEKPAHNTFTKPAGFEFMKPGDKAAKPDDDDHSEHPKKDVSSAGAPVKQDAPKDPEPAPEPAPAKPAPAKPAPKEPTPPKKPQPPLKKPDTPKKEPSPPRAPKEESIKPAPPAPKKDVHKPAPPEKEVHKPAPPAPKKEVHKPAPPVPKKEVHKPAPAPKEEVHKPAPPAPKEEVHKPAPPAPKKEVHKPAPVPKKEVHKPVPPAPKKEVKKPAPPPAPKKEEAKAEAIPQAERGKNSNPVKPWVVVIPPNNPHPKKDNPQPPSKKSHYNNKDIVYDDDHHPPPTKKEEVPHAHEPAPKKKSQPPHTHKKPEIVVAHPPPQKRKGSKYGKHAPAPVHQKPSKGMNEPNRKKYTEKESGKTMHKVELVAVKNHGTHGTTHIKEEMRDTIAVKPNRIHDEPIPHGYNCINFGPTRQAGMIQYNKKHVHGGVWTYVVPRSHYPNLATAYLSHLSGERFTYGLRVNHGVDIIIGFAEIFKPLCKKNGPIRLFNVRVGHQTRTVNAFSKVGCGRIFKVTFKNEHPHNNKIDIHFEGQEERPMVSTICYKPSHGKPRKPQIVKGAKNSVKNVECADCHFKHHHGTTGKTGINHSDGQKQPDVIYGKTTNNDKPIKKDEKPKKPDVILVDGIKKEKTKDDSARSSDQYDDPDIAYEDSISVGEKIKQDKADIIVGDEIKEDKPKKSKKPKKSDGKVDIILGEEIKGDKPKKEKKPKKSNEKSDIILGEEIKEDKPKKSKKDEGEKSTSEDDVSFNSHDHYDDPDIIYDEEVQEDKPKNFKKSGKADIILGDEIKEDKSKKSKNSNEKVDIVLGEEIKEDTPKKSKKADEKADILLSDEIAEDKQKKSSSKKESDNKVADADILLEKEKPEKSKGKETGSDKKNPIYEDPDIVFDNEPATAIPVGSTKKENVPTGDTSKSDIDITLIDEADGSKTIDGSKSRVSSITSGTAVEEADGSKTITGTASSGATTGTNHHGVLHHGGTVPPTAPGSTGGVNIHGTGAFGPHGTIHGNVKDDIKPVLVAGGTEKKSEEPSPTPEKSAKASSTPEKSAEASSTPEKSSEASSSPEKSAEVSSTPEKSPEASPSEKSPEPSPEKSVLPSSSATLLPEASPDKKEDKSPEPSALPSAKVEVGTVPLPVPAKESASASPSGEPSSAPASESASAEPSASSAAASPSASGSAAPSVSAALPVDDPGTIVPLPAIPDSSPSASVLPVAPSDNSAGEITIPSFGGGLPAVASSAAESMAASVPDGNENADSAGSVSEIIVPLGSAIAGAPASEDSPSSDAQSIPPLAKVPGDGPSSGSEIIIALPGGTVASGSAGSNSAIEAIPQSSQTSEDAANKNGTEILAISFPYGNSSDGNPSDTSQVLLGKTHSISPGPSNVAEKKDESVTPGLVLQMTAVPSIAASTSSIPSVSAAPSPSESAEPSVTPSGSALPSTSAYPTPIPSSDGVIVTTGEIETSAQPGVIQAPPIIEITDTDSDALAGKPISKEEPVRNVIKGEYAKFVRGNVVKSGVFAVIMGIVGSLLILLLIGCLFLAITGARKNAAKSASQFSRTPPYSRSEDGFGGTGAAMNQEDSRGNLMGMGYSDNLDIHVPDSAQSNGLLDGGLIVPEGTLREEDEAFDDETALYGNYTSRGLATEENSAEEDITETYRGEEYGADDVGQGNMGMANDVEGDEEGYGLPPPVMDSYEQEPDSKDDVYDQENSGEYGDSGDYGPGFDQGNSVDYDDSGEYHRTDVLPGDDTREDSGSYDVGSVPEMSGYVDPAFDDSREYDDYNYNQNEAREMSYSESESERRQVDMYGKTNSENVRDQLADIHQQIARQVQLSNDSQTQGSERSDSRSFDGLPPVQHAPPPARQMNAMDDNDSDAPEVKEDPWPYWYNAPRAGPHASVYNADERTQKGTSLGGQDLLASVREKLIARIPEDDDITVDDGTDVDGDSSWISSKQAPRALPTVPMPPPPPATSTAKKSVTFRDNLSNVPTLADRWPMNNNNDNTNDASISSEGRNKYEDATVSSRSVTNSDVSSARPPLLERYHQQMRENESAKLPSVQLGAAGSQPYAEADLTKNRFSQRFGHTNGNGDPIIPTDVDELRKRREPQVKELAKRLSSASHSLQSSMQSSIR